MRVLCRRTNKEYTKYCLAYSLFQSPSSVWRTTQSLHTPDKYRLISIHVLRVEDDLMPRPAGRGTIISIHVLRVEDDHSRWECNRFVKISIHVLRVEDDMMW